MKRALIVCLILCLIAPVKIVAKKKPFGNGLYWELNSGVLTISGNGSMPDGPDEYTASFMLFPWKYYKYKEKIKSVVIKDGVQTVGSRAFDDMKCIETVSIPASVTTIKSKAFWGISKLSNVYFSSGLQKIEKEAFAFCHNLTTISIPNSCTEIDTEAFLGCAGIKTIMVDDDNPIYDSRNNCNAIIRTKNNWLILGCINTVIPYNVKGIGEYAFMKCPLTSITIPNNVKVIENNAFAYCYDLKNITFPDTVYLSFEAFLNCNNLETVKIRDLRSLNSRAFLGCSSLKNVEIQNTSVESINNGVFQGCKSLRSIKIHQGVKSIGERAFGGCSNLTDVVIPKSVVKIEKYAFADCPNLALKISNNVTSIGDGAFAHIDNTGKILGYFSGVLRSLPEWLFDKGENEWKRIGLNPNSTKQYFSRIYDSNGNVIYESPNGRNFKLCNYSDNDTKYYIVDENGIKGLLNNKGKWIIPFSEGYSNLQFINNGYIQVRKGSYFGIITINKIDVISINRGYTYISDYDKSKHTFAFTKKGYTGECDAQGREISVTKLPPTANDIKATGSYASAVELKNGSTKYWKVNKGGRYGLTDAEGKIIIPAEMEALESAGSGYLRYKLNGFWGLMNYTGKILIDTDRGYTSIGDFKSFNKRFAYTMNGYKGECDATGRQISKIKVASTQHNSPNSSASNSVSNRDVVTFDLKGNIKKCIDSNGTHEFDRNGKLIPSGNQTIIYDQKGRISEIKVGVDKLSGGKKYEYDKDGRVDKEISSIGTLNSKIESRDDYVYDNSGQRTKRIISNVSGVSIIRYSDYKTDSYGNWISRVKDGKTTETRTIEYW